MGELPLAVLQERQSPGVVFNTGDTAARDNLTLDHTKFWTYGKGLVCMPLFALRDLKKSGEGLWV